MQIIDCHVNIGWDVNNIRKNLLPTEQTYGALLEKMDDFSISKSIILPFPSPGGQFSESTPWYDLENHYLIEANNHSKRLIPFLGVNPKDKYSVKNISSLSPLYRLKGVKFSHQIPMGFSIEKLIGHPLMRILQDNDLVFMVHVGTGKELGSEEVHTTLDYAIKVAKHYPDIRFIFCHLGRLHFSLIEALQLENVYLDTSALSLYEKWSQFVARDPLKIIKGLSSIGIIKKLVVEGYADKIIFGSDEPYSRQENEINVIKNAEIPDQAKRKIFYENVSKLLR